MANNLQTYSLNAGRINIVKGETLRHAIPVEVLAMGFTMKQLPRNSGDNVIYRRWLPYGGATTNANTINRWSVNAQSHIIAEGVTPTADTIVPQDVSATLQQYAAVYAWTDKTAEMYEDDIPQEAKTILGQRMALVREMIRFGSAKGITNAQYNGGTSRATVAAVLTLNSLRKMAQTLLANHAGMKTSVLSASPNFDTAAIEAGFIVLCHTDLEPDIRDIAGFVPTAKYASRKVLNEHEVGSVERFRFITSPELAAYADAGAAIAGTTLFSTTGTSADVYPVLVFAEDAAFDIALRGSKGFDLTVLPHTQKDKSDILGQRGYAASKFWSAALIVNNGWCGVIECARTSL